MKIPNVRTPNSEDNFLPLYGPYLLNSLPKNKEKRKKEIIINSNVSLFAFACLQACSELVIKEEVVKYFPLPLVCEGI